MSLPQFKISPSMFLDEALDVLKSFALREISYARFYQLLELALAGHESVIPDDWDDLVDIVVESGIDGFEKIRETLAQHKQSASATQETSLETNSSAGLERPPFPGGLGSLRQNPAAWKLVREWAVGTIEFPALIEKMKDTFGASFVEKDWSSTFNAVFDASSDEEELTLGEVPRPVWVVDEAMAILGININMSANPSRRHRSQDEPSHPRKRRAITSRFVDITAAEGDDEDSLSGSDNEASHESLVAQELEPAGRASYENRLHNLFDRYERAEGSHEASRGFMPLQTLQIQPRDSKRIYIVTFPTKNIAIFCRTALEARGLRCWDVARLLLKIYVEADSPAAISSACPPSHTSTIRSIVRVPDDELSFLAPSESLLRTRSWVRILRGLHRGDIGYLLTVEDAQCDILVVPRRRPYDKNVDHHDIQRRLFNENEARNAGLKVVPFRRSAGIWMCGHQYYHRGLLRISLAKSSLQTVEAPHPDQIALHAEAEVDIDLVAHTNFAFSSALWREGDYVRSRGGSLGEQRATIISIELDRGIVTVQPLESDVPPCTLPITEIRRSFRQGDDVKIFAGRHRGSVGTVLTAGEEDVTVLLETNDDMVVVPWAFLGTHLRSRVMSIVSDHPGLDVDLAPVTQKFDHAMQGDTVLVHSGYYAGRSGILDSIEELGWYWVNVPSTDKWEPCLVHSDEVTTSKPSHVLMFSKEHGYNVSVGDVLRIARGEHTGMVGMVRDVDFLKGEVVLRMEESGECLTIPIPLCALLFPFMIPRAPVGRDVWIIAGEFKGYRATLRNVNRETCVVSLLNHHSLELNKRHLATEQCTWIDGTPIEGPLLPQLESLIARSFRVEEPLHRPTPPPSPKSQITKDGNGDDDAWKITPEDTAVDYGCISWFFEPGFCDFLGYHLCFNVGAGYSDAKYVKRVVQSTCPSRFTNIDGVAPPGCASVFVTGNHAGRNLEYHFIPARFLTPASPTMKGQRVLVLQGEYKGQFCVVIRWMKKEKKGVVSPLKEDKKCLVLPASDICLAHPQNVLL